jgi:pyruvate/2-oxoglutarate dehydrogenase complex dihydrolipoamide dehydrogenase (E3) component
VHGCCQAERSEAHWRSWQTQARPRSSEPWSAGHLVCNALDVWALGECAGSAQFTHVSVDDFCIIRDNLAGGHRTTRHRLIPFCLFTDPPLARVGLSAREAGRRGVEVRVATLPMSDVLRTQTIAETHGFMKGLVDA